MKAISAPPTGVDAADRAERGLGPFGTLGCPIYPRHPYLPKGAKGSRVWWPSAVLMIPSPRLWQRGRCERAAADQDRGLYGEANQWRPFPTAAKCQAICRIFAKQ